MLDGSIRSVSRLWGSVREVAVPAHPTSADRAADLRALLGVGFALSTNATLLIDNELTIVAANQRATAMLGLAPCELQGRSIVEFRAPDRVEWFERDVQAFRAGDLDHVERETELITSSGKRLVADVRIDTVIAPSGERLMLVQLRDVTAARGAERALVASERRYRQLASSLPDASVLMFDHDLRLLLAFGEALLAGGYDPSAISGQLLADVLPANAFAILEPRYREVLTGRHLDFDYLSPVSGRRFRTRLRPVVDPGGIVIGGLAVTEDVSDDRMRQSRLEQIRRLSKLGSCWFDLRSGWNFDDELVELWGVDSADDLMTAMDRIIVADDRVAVLAARERLRAPGGRSSVSYRIVHGKSGQERCFQCTFESDVDADGVLVAAIATHVDVTESVVALEIAEMVKAEAAVDQRRILLRRISDALAGEYNGPEAPLQSIADLAAADLDSAAVLRVLRPDQQAIELDVTSHPDPVLRAGIRSAMQHSTLSFEPGPIRDLVIRRGQILSSVAPARSTPAHDRFAEQTGWRTAHSITAPLRHRGHVLGLFTVSRSDPGAPFQIGDEDLVQMLADRAGAVVAEHRVRLAAEREAEERIAQLTEQQRQLLAELAGMEIRERSQLAERVHDEPIQLIVAAALRIDTLQIAMPGADDEELNHLATLLEESVDWLRNLIQVDLTPPDLADGMGDALRQLADGVFFDAPAVQIVGPMHLNLSTASKSAAYRILREALINAHKHAHADNVTLRIEELDSMVVFSVTDDGVGADNLADTRHLGLTTMRTRAAAEGGQLHVQSTPGAGTTVLLTLPIPAVPIPAVPVAIAVPVPHGPLA